MHRTIKYQDLIFSKTKNLEPLKGLTNPNDAHSALNLKLYKHLAFTLIKIITRDRKIYPWCFKGKLMIPNLLFPILFFHSSDQIKWDLLIFKYTFNIFEKDILWNPIFEWYEQEWLLVLTNDKYCRNISPNSYSSGIFSRSLYEKQNVTILFNYKNILMLVWKINSQFIVAQSGTRNILNK